VRCLAEWVILTCAGAGSWSSNLQSTRRPAWGCGADIRPRQLAGKRLRTRKHARRLAAAQTFREPDRHGTRCIALKHYFSFALSDDSPLDKLSLEDSGILALMDDRKLAVILQIDVKAAHKLSQSFARRVTQLTTEPEARPLSAVVAKLVPVPQVWLRPAVE